MTDCYCYVCLEDDVVASQDVSCSQCNNIVCADCYSKIDKCPNCRNTYGSAGKPPPPNTTRTIQIILGTLLRFNTEMVAIATNNDINFEIDYFLQTFNQNLINMEGFLIDSMPVEPTVEPTVDTSAIGSDDQDDLPVVELLQRDDDVIHHNVNSKKEQIYNTHYGVIKIKTTLKSVLLTIPHQKFRFKKGLYGSRQSSEMDGMEFHYDPISNTIATDEFTLVL